MAAYRQGDGVTVQAIDKVSETELITAPFLILTVSMSCRIGDAEETSDDVRRLQGEASSTLVLSKPYSADVRYDDGFVTQFDFA